jgi:integrase
MRLADLAAMFDRFNSVNKRPRTAEFYRQTLKPVVAKYGDLDAEALRPAHLLEFRATWHLIMATQRLYRWATDEQQLIAVNPVGRMRRPRLGVRRRVLSAVELARYLRGARPAFRRLLLVARDSAARPQELSALTWPDLQWQGSAQDLRGELCDGRAFFLLDDYKGRSRRSEPAEPRFIPISPRVGRLLWRLVQKTDMTGAVLMNDQGKPWNRNSIRMQMRRLRNRVEPNSDGKRENVVCYTFRHSAATSYAAGGMQTSVLQQLLGHANIRTTTRYIHLHQRHLLDTWGAFHRGRRPKPGDK